MPPGYIYLLRPASSIAKNELVYKIGRTRRTNFTRFNEYPKGSVLISQSEFRDCVTAENRFINLFKQHFVHRADYGREYFEGDHEKMKCMIYREAIQQSENTIISQVINNTEIETNDKEEETPDFNLIESAPHYSCENCRYNTKHKRDYIVHLSTRKHKLKMSGKEYPPTKSICVCGKEYANRHSLSRHKKNCTGVKRNDEPIAEPDPVIDANTVLNLVKSNQELQCLLLEQTKQSYELINRLVRSVAPGST